VASEWEKRIPQITDESFEPVLRESIKAVQDKKLEGRKDDKGKLRYDLEAQDARRGLVTILTFGANKYEDRNWEKGMLWGRVYAAAQRHLSAWWSGEELDAESGLPHLDHAACCIHFLQAYSKRGVGKDDRPK